MRIGVRRKTNGKARAKGRTATLAAAPSLSLLNPAVGVFGNIATRKIAILAAEGVRVRDVAAVREALRRRGAQGLVLAARLGELKGEGGSLTVDHALATMPSVVFDALVIPGGRKSADVLRGSGDALHFVAETFKHVKAICVVGEGADVLAAAGLPANALQAEGIVSGDTIEDVLDEFVTTLGRHRAWSRSKLAEAVPASGRAGSLEVCRPCSHRKARASLQPISTIDHQALLSQLPRTLDSHGLGCFNSASRSLRVDATWGWSGA
jgi:catalase